MGTDIPALSLFIPTLVSRYLVHAPDTRIDLLERLSFDIPRLVIEGEADIGVYHALRPAPGLASWPYIHDRVVLVVPQGHALAARAAVRLEEAVAGLLEHLLQASRAGAEPHPDL